MRLCLEVVGIAMMIGISLSGQAAEFVLATGATIRGEWLNATDGDADVYLVASEYGGRLSLRRSQVAEVRTNSAVEQEYERLAPRMADTPDGQWRMAEWCRTRGLEPGREVHLRRVVELDPNHEAARRALGYSQLGGKWTTREEHLKEQGFVRHQGQWRLPQDIALTEEQQAEEAIRKDWLGKIALWRSQLGTEKGREAMQNLQAVRDPLAMDAVLKLLRSERTHKMRQFCLEMLDQIEGEGPTHVFVHLALTHSDEEVFHTCVDRLVVRCNGDVVRQFVQALKSKNNPRVNRAAYALARFGDASVITPLIDALITVHEQYIPGSDLVTTTFYAQPDMGPQVTGSSGASVTPYYVQNQEVLKALASLSGVSFGFDQQAWRNWHALEQRQQRAVAIDTRRGE